ncbi:unnamed protein product [Symbiodinium sp. CCMP2592]|nr:unnamed protein product [Symbiodinium sp. CCMP2592]
MHRIRNFKLLVGSCRALCAIAMKNALPSKCSKAGEVYGMMEEFLELSRRVSVQTIRGFVQAVHKRIPPIFLEKEFVDLAECTAGNDNVQRNFRSWLRRQQWMKALPPPTTIQVNQVNSKLSEPNFLGLHSIFLIPDWSELNFIIPLECHGDDAEMHKRRSFAICTVASALLGPGIATWDHKLLLSCFDNSAAGESTATEIDCWICWGLVCAAAGVYLDHDWYGRPFSPDYMPDLYAKAGKQIAGPFRFVFAGHKGDQKYLHACYKFENYWTSEEMCRSCAASKNGSSPMGYVHFGLGAQHRSTIYSTADFIRKCGSTPWLAIPGFAVERIWDDWLHIVDLAISPDACASALLELTKSANSPWPARNQELRLELAYQEFAQACKREKVRNRAPPFSLKTLKSTTPGVFATLSQKHLSGAESVVMVKWLRSVTVLFSRANPDRYWLNLAAIFVNLAGMREEMSGYDCALPAEVIRKIETHYYLFRASYNYCAYDACGRSKMLFKLRPKIHRLEHLVYDQTAVTCPLRTSTYGDEDMVGRIKMSAALCHPQGLGLQVLYRYAAYVGARWHRKSLSNEW